MPSRERWCGVKWPRLTSRRTGSYCERSKSISLWEDILQSDEFSRLSSATDEEEEDTDTMALAEEGTVVMVPRRQLSKRLEHFAVSALCAAVNELGLET